MKKKYSNIYNEIQNIPNNFCYLYLGHYIDRKNVDLLIKAFYEVFKNKNKKPALILKTTMSGSSYMDREEIIKKIKRIKATVNSKDLPEIYLLHGDLTDPEINQLYNHPKVKAMVSLSRGEGFGRPLIEFTLSKKPLITTSCSGPLDFLNSNMSVLINTTNVEIPQHLTNQWLIEGSKWSEPDQSQVGFYLKDVFENYKKYIDGGKRQGYRSKTEFNTTKMKELIKNTFDKYIPEFPKQVPLLIPNLMDNTLPNIIKK